MFFKLSCSYFSFKSTSDNLCIFIFYQGSSTSSHGINSTFGLMLAILYPVFCLVLTVELSGSVILIILL